MLRMAGRDPRQKATANLAHVVAVAGQILLGEILLQREYVSGSQGKTRWRNQCSHEPMASPLAGAQ